MILKITGSFNVITSNKNILNNVEQPLQELEIEIFEHSPIKVNFLETEQKSKDKIVKLIGEIA